MNECVIQVPEAMHRRGLLGPLEFLHLDIVLYIKTNFDIRGFIITATVKDSLYREGKRA